MRIIQLVTVGCILINFFSELRSSFEEAAMQYVVTDYIMSIDPTKDTVPYRITSMVCAGALFGPIGPVLVGTRWVAKQCGSGMIRKIDKEEMFAKNYQHSLHSLVWLAAFLTSSKFISIVSKKLNCRTWRELYNKAKILYDKIEGRVTTWNK